MIIEHARSVHTSDRAAFAWAGLRRSQNVETTTNKLIHIHSIPRKQHQNAKKQASQIRYCLVQAREYFAAASVVSLATKPNLLYYGLMSLALAEILLKQSGNSSLDKAREQNRHHGLTMTVGDAPTSPTLTQAASAIKAHPVWFEGARRGTFELWHKSSREHPIVGLKTDYQPTGGSTSGYHVIYSASDQPYESFPDSGMSLAQALSGVPELAEDVSMHGLPSDLIRGTAKLDIYLGPQWRSQFNILFHPNSACAKVIEQIKVAPRDLESVTCSEIGGGYQFVISNNWIHGIKDLPVPPAACNVASTLAFAMRV
jgi:hypothetical protein